MATQEARLTRLETQMEQVQDQLKTISRNVWAAIGGLGLLVSNVVLNRLGIGAQVNTKVGAIMFLDYARLGYHVLTVLMSLV